MNLRPPDNSPTIMGVEFQETDDTHMAMSITYLEPGDRGELATVVRTLHFSAALHPKIAEGIDEMTDLCTILIDLVADARNQAPRRIPSRRRLLTEIEEADD